MVGSMITGLVSVHHVILHEDKDDTSECTLLVFVSFFLKNSKVENDKLENYFLKSLYTLPCLSFFTQSVQYMYADR